MPNEEIKNPIRDFFVNKGYRELKDITGVDLAFSDGETRIGIKIFTLSGSITKLAEKIRLFIYEALNSRKYSKYYIALPGLRVGALPTSREFEASGIGLLKVSEEVEELIPARLLSDSGEKVEALNSPRIDEAALRVIAEELLRKNLSTMIREAIEAVLREEFPIFETVDTERLEKVIRRLEEATSTLAALISSGGNAIQSSGFRSSRSFYEKRTNIGEVYKEEVPEWVLNNPWVERIRNRREAESEA
ncbi:MAG: hypothetical protein QW291_04685 [Thermofilaceae archaeon]